MLENKLSSNSLLQRKFLPEKPNKVILEGAYVRLEPLVIERDAQALFDVSNGHPVVVGNRSIDAYDANELIWRYMFDGPFKDKNEFISTLIPQVEATQGLCFCVFDVASGKPVGVANFLNNFPTHLKMELGGIWYSPVVQGTFTNTETTYLMLKHGFELGYRRLEWKCHTQNERSRKAALRMGFKFEGIQENHMIVKECNRDTAWYRLLDTEWDEVKKKLELFLYK